MSKPQLNKEDLVQLGLLLLLFVGIFALGLHWWKFTRNKSVSSAQESIQEAPKRFEAKVRRAAPKQRHATKESLKPSLPHKKPSYVRLIQKKHNGDYWLEVQTDASSHYPVRLEFLGRRGSVLGYPSYRLLKTLRQKSDFKFNANKIGIPPGRYHITATVETFEDTESLRLGTGHGHYQERLRAYKKQIGFSHMNEKRTMLRLLKQVQAQSEQLLTAMRKGKVRSQRQVQSYLHIKDKTLQKINWRNRNSYVFAPEYYELKTILSTARTISPNAGQRAVRGFQNQLARLNAKVQQSSLW